jgi:chromosome segregation ATPase
VELFGLELKWQHLTAGGAFVLGMLLLVPRLPWGKLVRGASLLEKLDERFDRLEQKHDKAADTTAQHQATVAKLLDQIQAVHESHGTLKAVFTDAVKDINGWTERWRSDLENLKTDASELRNELGDHDVRIARLEETLDPEPVTPPEGTKVSP